MEGNTEWMLAAAFRGLGPAGVRRNGTRTGQIDFEMSPQAGALALLDVMEHAFCA